MSSTVYYALNSIATITAYQYRSDERKANVKELFIVLILNIIRYLSSSKKKILMNE